MEHPAYKRGKFIIFILLFQLLGLLSTVSLLIAKAFVDIDWFYVFLPIIITIGMPFVLILGIFCFLLLIILIFGKSKGIKDIRTVIKSKKDE